MTKEAEIAEIGVQKGVDLGFEINDSLLSSVVLQEELFHCSMSRKWTTSLHPLWNLVSLTIWSYDLL